MSDNTNNNNDSNDVNTPAPGNGVPFGEQAVVASGSMTQPEDASVVPLPEPTAAEKLVAALGDVVKEAVADALKDFTDRLSEVESNVRVLNEDFQDLDIDDSVERAIDDCDIESRVESYIEYDMDLDSRINDALGDMDCVTESQVESLIEDKLTEVLDAAKGAL